MKRLFAFFGLVCLILPVAGQQNDYSAYGLEKNMPLFFEQLKSSLTYPLAWQEKKYPSFDSWREKAKATLYECMNNLPPAPTTYQTQVLATEKRKGYTARKIAFNLSEWYRVPAYLLVPEGKGPFPAIIMLHDHGAHFSIGKEKMVRPFDVPSEVLEDADDWAARCYDSQYAGDYFAANGYIVLSIDALLWGERGRKDGTTYDTQQALASNFLQMGTSWGSIITIDDVRCAEFLASLPETDAEKIGALGFSMGAHRAWMLAAATDRVKASAAICWMNTTDSLMTLTNNQNKGGSSYSMIIPGIRRYLDYPHVASIACPKPALFFNGTQDKLFPVEGVKDAFREMRHVWESQQASDKLVTKIWEEKHFFNKEMQRETLEFFDEWFKRK